MKFIVLNVTGNNNHSTAQTLKINIKYPSIAEYNKKLFIVEKNVFHR